MDLIREKLRARGHHRACGGGESSSSSDQITNMTDKRVAGGDGGAQVSGDGNTVTVTATDHGAVMAGVETARSAIDFADRSSRTNAALTLGLFSAVADTEQRALSTADKAYGSALDAVGAAYSSSNGLDPRVVPMVGLAVLGLAAISILRKRA